MIYTENDFKQTEYTAKKNHDELKSTITNDLVKTPIYNALSGNLFIFLEADYIYYNTVLKKWRVGDLC